MKRLIAVAALWLCCGVVASASAEQRNPFESDEAAIRIGNALFANRCALCHGGDAKGSLGPDLTQRWARGASDESAFNIIRNGVPGSSMPPNACTRQRALGHRRVPAQRQRDAAARYQRRRRSRA